MSKGPRSSNYGKQLAYQMPGQPKTKKSKKSVKRSAKKGY